MSQDWMYSRNPKRSRAGSITSYSQLTSSQAPMTQFGGSVGSGMSLASQSRKFQRKQPALRYKGRDKRVAKIARTVAARLVDKNIEVKYQNIGFSGVLGQSKTTAGPSTASGHLTHTISYPSAGTGSASSIGDKIRIKYINLSVKFIGQANFMNPKNVKFILAQFNGPNPSPSAASILNPDFVVDSVNGGTGAGTVVLLYDFQSLRNVDQGEQVKVLYEKEMCIDTYAKGGESSTQPVVTCQTYQLSIPMYNRPLEQAAGFPVNHVYAMYFLCDSGECGSNNPTILGLSEYQGLSGLTAQVNYQIAYQDA